MFVVFGPGGGLAVPVLVGGGIEYALDRDLTLTANLRAGPSVPPTGNPNYPYWEGYWCTDRLGRLYRCGTYYSTTPALEALIGLTFRL
jgi:hypothetical protein